MPNLTHLVSLAQAAGVEAHFTEFVERARVARPEWSQSWLAPTRALHPFFADRLRATLARVVYAKYRWGVKLPSWPEAIRAWHCRRELEAAGTEVLMIWNRSAKIGFVLDALGADRCIHWEHGAAWDSGHEADRRRYFRRITLAIANSTASARVLQLLWGYSGTMRVCRNALRPSLLPGARVAKAYPAGAVTLGVAARLFPVKGVALTLQALPLIVARGLDARLEIAGEGPERGRLESLARRLGVADRVRFRGAVRDMREFYTRVDCLVHPPLTEAFGLVALEAAAHGCPVIAAAIDGLPEAVADGVSGRCVVPTLPLADYPGLGGSLDGVPQLVYEPRRDALVEPPLVDPQALAAAVAELFADARSYETLSAAASAHVLASPTFAQHVDAVLAVVDEFRARHAGA
ncbi:MAG TPA: glycosyltransferase [Gammaproteobacteria bacterium]|nr:glycosyltransferase [Gammaproteobacteria bacterium]